MTIATSPTPICCRWSWIEAWIEAAAAVRCRSCPTSASARATSRDFGLSALRRRRAGGGEGDGRCSSRRWPRGRDGQAGVRNWVMGELVRRPQQGRPHGIDEFSGLGRVGWAALLDLISDRNAFNGKIAKEVLEDDGGDRQDRSRRRWSRKRGLRQVTDTGGDRSRRWRRHHDGSTPTRWRSIARGKDKLFGFFVGQVMKAMAGKGNPGLVNEALVRALN